ncbi:hypothetical protein [Nostoc sp. DedQUE09]|nr:hypothetical protein [Nostoc sp. DedQUE09]MDZ7953629.1 hypothetical protein [Nostoc sp. DedQUE09]
MYRRPLLVSEQFTLTTQHPAPSTHYSAPSTQHSLLSTQHSYGAGFGD